MLFEECKEELKSDARIQIFATDIDSRAVETARAGVYPHSITVDVSLDRLKRFFTAEDNSYRVKKSVRDLVVFASQNVVTDPPFSKLDLISCRNLLIYMGPKLQKESAATFPLLPKQRRVSLPGHIGDYRGILGIVRYH